MMDQDNRVEAFFSRIRAKWLAPLFELVSAVVFVLIAAEGIAFVALKLAAAVPRNGDRAAPGGAGPHLDVYADAEWAADYWQEWEASHVTRYHPYLEYRRPPYEGRYINVDSAGVRRTVPVCGADHADPVRVFFLGGSGAWGTGARDQGTIPSHLARMLCEDGVPAVVTNYGESGYTNTQEMIRLILELREGRDPDIVIFYNGVNDVYSSYQNRRPGLPQNVVRRMRPAVRGPERVTPNRLGEIALLTNTGQVVSALGGRLRTSSDDTPEWSPPEGADADTLDRLTLATMHGNIEVVRALGDDFGFRSFFYWQPALYTKRVLSEQERDLPRDSAFGAMYLRVTDLVRDDDRIVDLSDVLESDPRSAFIDEFHVSERANERIARRIFEGLLEAVPRLWGSVAGLSAKDG